jgi:hypothetical protein
MFRVRGPRGLVRLGGLFLVAFLSLQSLGAVESPAVLFPDPAHLLDTLKKEHPRLLANSDTFSRLKERVATDAQMRVWSAHLRESADRILGEPPSRYEIPDGLRLLSTSRRVLHRIYTLAMIYRLEGEARHLERAWRELDAAARFEDWNPRHFLDTAEMTHAFAIAYDWLYDAWSETQRDQLRQAIRDKGLKLGVACHHGTEAYGWWTKSQHNWNQVCNGGITLGALAIAEAEPALAREFIHAALRSIQFPMRHFAPDGAWNEGPGYWNYATSYNCLFPVYITGPLGRAFNYADGGDGTIRAPHLFWLSRKFNRPSCADYQRRVASPHPLDLLWGEPEGSRPPAELPLDKYFREVEVATLRSAWHDPNALFLGFKAGDNQANHSNLDLGSFVLDALGQRWALDLGADDYNLPGYFGGQRWTYYRMRAEGHNTLVLNPGEKPDQNPKASARILNFQDAPGGPFLVADLTPAYAVDARRVWRGIKMPERKQVLIQDEIECSRPTTAWWFMHTAASIQIQPDPTVAFLQMEGAQLQAKILAPPRAVFQVMNAGPLPSSPHPNKQATNQGIQKLAVHLKEIQEVNVTVLLTPCSGGKAAPGGRDDLTPLRDW